MEAFDLKLKLHYICNDLKLEFYTLQCNLFYIHTYITFMSTLLTLKNCNYHYSVVFFIMFASAFLYEKMILKIAMFANIKYELKKILLILSYLLESFIKMKAKKTLHSTQNNRFAIYYII